MAQGLLPFTGYLLANASGQLVGAQGLDGKEYILSVLTNNSGIGAPPAGIYSASVALTGGTINGTTVGVTTPAIVKTSNLQATYTDSSGTPGNVTNNSPRGRAAFAAAGSAVVVTSTLVTAASSVFVQLGGSDATLTNVRVTAAAGSFTVTGNAAATATTPFDFLVVN